MDTAIRALIAERLDGYEFSAKQLADPMATGWYLYVSIARGPNSISKSGVRPSHVQEYMCEIAGSGREIEGNSTKASPQERVT